MLRCGVHILLGLFLSVSSVSAGPIEISLDGTGGTSLVDVRMESLAERVRSDGFPKVMAGSQIVEKVWVEDIDLDGTCSGEDNLIVLLPTPIPEKIMLVFDQVDRKAPLATGKEIQGAEYKAKTAGYTATVTNRGGELASLKDGAGRELLFLPIQYRLYSGGFDCLTRGVEAFVPQNGAAARMFLIETPARNVLVCTYNLDDTPCMTEIGPLTAGLRGRTIYRLLPDRVGVENHLFETGRNNFPYTVRFDLHFPTAIFSSIDIKERKVKDRAVPAFDIGVKSAQTQFGVVLESPGWQFAYTSDGRERKWGDFLVATLFADSLKNSMWLMPGKIAPAGDGTPLLKKDAFRRAPADLAEVAAKIDSVGRSVAELKSGNIWTMPVDVQLEAAKGFGAMADQCWKVYRPVQSQRLARESAEYAERALALAEQAKREKWIDPGHRNTSGEPGFTRGVYWPWFGCPERMDQRAEYARRIGINCVHSMDVQAWPEVEEKLTAQAVDAADFQASLTFLDRLQRHELKGLLLTMDPFWPRWGNRLPFPGGPDDFATPPDQLIQSMRWVERYVNQLKKHPALCGYVIHNEPVGLNFNGKDPQVKSAFIKWLKKRHTSIDALNRNWRTKYADWEAIAIPDLRKSRHTVPGTVVGQTPEIKAFYSNQAACYDFVTFQQECFVNHLACLKDVAVKNDPARPAFSKMCDANLVLSYATEAFKSARAQHKVYGTNLYYGLQAGAIGHGIGNMNFMQPVGIDMEHEGSGLPVWCTEYNQGWWKPYRMGLRGEFTVLVWGMFGKGLRGLFPFAWSPGQWALFNGDDSPAPAAEAMCKFYSQLKAMDGILAGSSKPKPEIAFYYARPTFYHRDLINPGHPERPLSTPINQLRSLYEAISLVGGYSAGFVTDERIAGGGLDRYKVVIVIEGEYMPKATLARMRQFVECGGTLVIVGAFARFDEYGFAYGSHPGSGMREVMGAVMKETTPSIITAREKKCWMPPIEDSIRAFTYKSLDAKTTIIGTYADKSPAVIEHSFGKGKVLSVGGTVGVATDAYPGRTAEFFTEYFEGMKILPSAKAVNYFETSRNELAILGLKDAKGDDWLILVNGGNYPVRPTVRWTATKAAGDASVINMLSGQTISCKDVEGAPEFVVRLDPYETAFVGKLQVGK